MSADKPEGPTELAAKLVEAWHQEFCRSRLSAWAIGELIRRVAALIAPPTWRQICLAYQGDTKPCETPCLHCHRIEQVLRKAA